MIVFDVEVKLATKEQYYENLGPNIPAYLYFA